ncbi:MAG: two-CW domain-containing protein [Thermodesulfobacteriota bacterium]
MKNTEFSLFRKKLGKTQKEIAQLLGTSIKAVHSYEQGWRTIPPHVERQMFFLLSKNKHETTKRAPCWVIKKCPDEQKNRCPAWEFNAGDLCWFICGTLCQGEAKPTWREKIKLCRSCKVFKSIFS